MLPVEEWAFDYLIFILAVTAAAGAALMVLAA